jgi:hypothetical protein
MPIAEGAAIVSAISDVASGLRARRERLRASGRDDRDRAAAWLSETADTLERVVSRLRAGESASGACAQMLQHAHDLKPAIGEQVGKQYADEASQMLTNNYQVEQLIFALEADPQRDRLIKPARRSRREVACGRRVCARHTPAGVTGGSSSVGRTCFRPTWTRHRAPADKTGATAPPARPPQRHAASTGSGNVRHRRRP